MRKHVFFTMILFAACANPAQIPPGIMGYDKMKLIIWDLANAGEYAKMKIPLDSVGTLEKQTEIYFLEVFKNHDVSKEDFYKSYHYYEAHPDKNKILMDSVANYAQRKRLEEYNAIKRIE